jgi:protein-S-isoprenylcysteine O-methyltransferase Ste14
MRWRASIKTKWLATAISALAGGIIGAEAVMRPHGGLLVSTIGPWFVRHGLTSSAAFDTYDAAVRSNIDRLLPGLAIYVLFSLYWVIASRNRADDAKADPSPYGLHKLLVGLSLLLICLPMPGLTLRVLPQSALLLAVGILSELAGVTLAVAARRALGLNWSREVRIAVGHELVQSGPYAHIRHPIYTGAILLSLGLSIQSGLLSALVGIVLLILAYVRKIAQEERMLGIAFGASFDQYRARSWALIPFLI